MATRRGSNAERCALGTFVFKCKKFGKMFALTKPQVLNKIISACNLTFLQHVIVCEESMKQLERQGKQTLRGLPFEDYRTKAYCAKIKLRSDIISAHARKSSGVFTICPI